jgi:hypothetical protein
MPEIGSAEGNAHLFQKLGAVLDKFLLYLRQCCGTVTYFASVQSFPSFLSFLTAESLEEIWRHFCSAPGHRAAVPQIQTVRSPSRGPVLLSAASRKQRSRQSLGEHERHCSAQGQAPQEEQGGR